MNFGLTPRGRGRLANASFLGAKTNTELGDHDGLVNRPGKAM